MRGEERVVPAMRPDLVPQEWVPLEGVKRLFVDRLAAARVG